MSKILVYGNRKSDDLFYDASTLDRENAAYLALIKVLDEDWDVYQDLSPQHEALLTQAKNGNADSARRLITARRRYEYENVYEAELIDATVEPGR